jgi:hypothetical protein
MQMIASAPRSVLVGMVMMMVIMAAMGVIAGRRVGRQMQISGS